MQSKSQLLQFTTHWQQKTTSIIHALLFPLCFFFTVPVFAETNAQGIEIEFILDDLIEGVAEVVEPLSATNQQGSLELTPSQELTSQNNNLWHRIQQGYLMPDIVSPYTNKYENLYASRPDYVAKMMARSQRYLFYVVDEVEKRGMPMEIALLPMIESAYNPVALSRSKAMGIWQFMPATGKYFGLQQNWWADHRRDVTASTEAALDYLEKLHGMFDSWDLALAAYNAGEGTVGRAIEKNRKAGLATDYQSLSLPVETMHYVPKLQAIKNIVNNPEQYGLTIDSIPNEAYFAEIDAPSQIDAKLAAKLAGISNIEFTALNPSFKRPIVASRDNTHKLLLPVSAIDNFQENLGGHNKSLISWKTYKAKRGEKVASIAKKFNISTNKLRTVNSLTRDRKLNNALHLLVPAKQANTKKINIARLANQKVHKRSKARHVSHKIRRGETLSALAKRYGTNTRALMKINRLKSTRLKIGQVIRVKGKRIRAKTKRM